MPFANAKGPNCVYLKVPIVKILVVKFDSRAREASIITFLQRHDLDYELLSVPPSGISALGDWFKHVPLSSAYTHVLFIGFELACVTWFLRYRKQKKVTGIVRLGGDPILVPMRRLQGYVSENALSNFAKIVRLFLRIQLLKIGLRWVDRVIVVSTR